MAAFGYTRQSISIRISNGISVYQRMIQDSAPTTASLALGRNASTRIITGYIESFLIYNRALPDTEIQRISAIPTAWTMANAAANILIPNAFSPTNKTASGTTNLRTAPGAATTLITGLAAGTLIQDTGARTTVSSVPYAQVTANIGGGNVTGWIPVSQITSL